MAEMVAMMHASEAKWNDILYTMTADCNRWETEEVHCARAKGDYTIFIFIMLITFVL